MRHCLLINNGTIFNKFTKIIYAANSRTHEDLVHSYNILLNANSVVGANYISDFKLLRLYGIGIWYNINYTFPDNTIEYRLIGSGRRIGRNHHDMQMGVPGPWNGSNSTPTNRRGYRALVIEYEAEVMIEE